MEISLEDALTKIGKAFGQEAIHRLGDDPVDPVSSISTGSIALDRALGVGGLPRGRIVEIYGPEMSGKTTLALHVIANAQKEGGVCAFVDAEYALNLDLARAVGVKTGDLLVSQPDNGEQGLEIADALIRSGDISVVVIDSVAALVPRAEIEGDMGDAHVGLHARLMGQAMRKFTGATGKTGTLIIFINQLRMQIGVTWGNPEITPGGKALKFYSSVRLDVRKAELLKTGNGQRTKVKVVKNKVAAPFKTCEFDLLWGEGISRESELIDLGIEKGIVKQKGAWFSYGAGQWQGKENFRRALREDGDTAGELERAIKDGG